MVNAATAPACVGYQLLCMCRDASHSVGGAHRVNLRHDPADSSLEDFTNAHSLAPDHMEKSASRLKMEVCPLIPAICEKRDA
jgi:hypothetical protein